jgi:reactive intermediate/imine deaminase
MARIEARTDLAPAPIAPYSQAVRIGNIIAIAGQGGVDPATAMVVSPDVAAQTVQAFKNIEAVLTSASASLNDVVRVEVYLSDLADFAAMNVEYAKVFTTPYPARTTVGVQLPSDLKVEITVLAVIG